MFNTDFLVYSSAVSTSWKDDLSETLGFSSPCFYMDCRFSALKPSKRETTHSRNLKCAFSETYFKILVPC